MTAYAWACIQCGRQQHLVSSAATSLEAETDVLCEVAGVSPRMAAMEAERDALRALLDEVLESFHPALWGGEIVCNASPEELADWRERAGLPGAGG